MTPETGQTCAKCGNPARVCVLRTYHRGAPVLESLCLTCADLPDERLPPASNDAARVAGRLGPTLMLAAAMLMVFVASVDFIGVTGSAGFGWYQYAGIFIGGMLGFVGLLLHVHVLTLIGSVILVTAFGADVLGFAGKSGMGWKQCIAFVATGGLLVLGVILRRRR